MTYRARVYTLVLAATFAFLLECLEFTLLGGDSDTWWIKAAALLADVCVVIAVAAVAASSRRARAQIHRHREVEAAAGALSSDWLWEADLEGRITYSSPGVEQLLGYTAAELTGRNIDEVLFSEAGMRAEGRRQGLSRDGWHHKEAEWRHKDGSLVRLVGSAMTIRDQRGRVVGYRGTRRLVETSPSVARELSHAGKRLTQVLECDQVDVALQPIVSLLDGRLVGVEALARFHDGRPPDTWFREAEHLGRARELDQHMFTRALDLLSTVPIHLDLSINADPDLIVDAAFRRRLLSSGLPLHRVLIEITEHARVRDYTALRSAVATLREHRVRFAIDDTGAGYASLNHVLQLRPDVIKLDRALLEQLNDDPARRSLVTALVLLAMDIGATVTGEGVESAAQLDTLSTLAVDHVQGYYLARPSTNPACWESWWTRRWISELASVRLGPTPGASRPLPPPDPLS
jgi:PAS domain S-box-containing protein